MASDFAIVIFDSYFWVFDFVIKYLYEELCEVRGFLFAVLWEVLIILAESIYNSKDLIVYEFYIRVFR